MPRSSDYDDKTDEERPVPRPLRRNERITPAIAPNEARQGVTHHNVRYVLGISLGVAVLVLALVYFAFFGGATPI